MISKTLRSCSHTRHDDMAKKECLNQRDAEDCHDYHDDGSYTKHEVKSIVSYRDAVFSFIEKVHMEMMNNKHCLYDTEAVKTRMKGVEGRV